MDEVIVRCQVGRVIKLKVQTTETHTHWTMARLDEDAKCERKQLHKELFFTWAIHTLH